MLCDPDESGYVIEKNQISDCIWGVNSATKPSLYHQFVQDFRDRGVLEVAGGSRDIVAPFSCKDIGIAPPGLELLSCQPSHSPSAAQADGRCRSLVQDPRNRGPSGPADNGSAS
eukprot:1396910-Pyramimonas_sp.AAC.1